MKSLLWFIFILCNCFTINAQKKFDFNFYKNLINQKEPEMAVLYLNNSIATSTSKNQSDSINYLKGLIFFEKKQFDSTVFALENINYLSPIYNHSVFLKSISMIYKNDKESSIFNSINSIRDSNIVVNEIKKMMLASNALIHKNHNKFDSIILQIDTTIFITKSLISTLSKWSEKRNLKNKNKFLAASLSAIIPGLGKVYVGKKFDGLNTFLTHIPLALIMYESYYVAGFNSSRFITFSTIASLFYIGNIITSYHNVNIERKEVNNERKNEILLQCNIMLRNYYN